MSVFGRFNLNYARTPLFRSRRAAMREAQARKEEEQRAKQREGMELLAKALQEKAEGSEKAAQRRRRWRVDHEGEVLGLLIFVLITLQTNMYTYTNSI